MDLHLNNKTAVVTGATAGIGFAIAQVLLQEGATVIIPGRSQAKLDEAASSLIGGARLRIVHCDLATSEGAKALIRELPDYTANVELSDEEDKVAPLSSDA